MRRHFIIMLIMAGIGLTIASEVSGVLKCPDEISKVIDPKNGVGTMSCTGSESCAKLSSVSCVGHRIYKSDKCYKWDCHGIPKSLDSLTDIDIKGPAYDKIEITVTQTPILIVLASILSVVFLFLYDPSFATGIIVGGLFSSGGSTSRSLES